MNRESSKIKILIVDDEIEIRNVLGRFLSKQGYLISSAADGEEAIAKLKSEHPRIILLDIRMPKKDGIAVLKEIKKIDPAVGIIMTTAIQDEEIAKRAITLGAWDYICKPIDFFYLENSILAKAVLMSE